MRYAAWCLFFFWLSISPSMAANLLFTEGKLTSDSDDADQYLFVAGAGHGFDSGFLSKFEIGGGTRKFDDNAGSETFDLVRLRLQSVKQAGWQARLQLDYLDGQEWSPLAYAFTVTSKPHDRWYLEFATERDLVDTVTAIRHETLLDSYSLSVDYKFTDTFTLVGAPLVQHFSDSNQRWGGVARLIYTYPRFENASLELKGRVLKSDFDGIGYFSPETLQEYFLILGLALPFGGDDWVARLRIGPGLQVVKPHEGDRETKDAYLGELKLRGWFTQSLGLEAVAGCSSAVQASGSYEYCYGDARLTYHW